MERRILDYQWTSDCWSFSLGLKNSISVRTHWWAQEQAAANFSLYGYQGRLYQTGKGLTDFLLPIPAPFRDHAQSSFSFTHFLTIRSCWHQWGGKKIFFHHDLFTAVLQRQRGFDEAKLIIIVIFFKLFTVKVPHLCCFFYNSHLVLACYITYPSSSTP